MEKELSEVEIHPCSPFNVENAKILILGTFPPKKEHIDRDIKEKTGKIVKKQFFYYQSSKNQFWGIMDEVLKVEKEYNGQKLYGNKDVKFKEQVLKDKGLGLADIFKKINRRKDKEWSHNDTYIRNPEYVDLDLEKLNKKGVLILIPNNTYDFLKKDSEFQKIERKFPNLINHLNFSFPRQPGRGKHITKNDKVKELTKIFRNIKIIN